MTLIAILTALGLGHFAPGLGELRRTDWVGRWTAAVARQGHRIPGFDGAAGVVAVLLPPLLAAALLQSLLAGLYSGLVVFVFSVLVLVWAWGPRDLDEDVEAYLAARETDDTAAQRRAAQRIVPGELPADSESEAETVVAWIYLGALERWFGVVFWVLVLGPLGAALYRLAQVIARDAVQSEVGDSFVAAARRLRRLLDWPVSLLMATGLAIVGHFDAVIHAWRAYYRREQCGFFALDPGYLLAAARATLAAPPTGWTDESDAERGATGQIRASMNLVWRVLFVWLSVVALLTVAGWAG